MARDIERCRQMLWALKTGVRNVIPVNIDYCSASSRGEWPKSKRGKDSQMPSKAAAAVYRSLIFTSATQKSEGFD
jgi:hypothetical protein